MFVAMSIPFLRVTTGAAADPETTVTTARMHCGSADALLAPRQAGCPIRKENACAGRVDWAARTGVRRN
jgi:hypothetical protein